MMSLSEFIRKQYAKGEIWYSDLHFSNHLPGSHYKYSNMGANITAYIIQQATGVDYAEFVRAQILEPLQMNASGWQSKNYTATNASTLYWYGYPIPSSDLVTYPDGNFTTNVVDYGKFLSTVIRGYGGQDNLISAKSYQEMMEEPVSSEFRKGIFWTVDSDKIGHSGSDLGVLTHAYFLRENGNGMIVFVNTSDTENASTEVRDIYRTLLKYSESK
jgi:CubicO group peptidase (beta-lactamase class C family)